MGTPIMSQISVFAFNFPPKGWAFCNGQFLPINQNQALFSLLGTTFGGNGQTTFALPDLRGRVPTHFGQSFVLGQVGGQEAHTVTISEMPTHTHVVAGSSIATGGNVSANGRFLGGANNAYHAATGPLTTLTPGTVGNAGGSQAHLNMQPFLTLNFCIALQGVFPSQS